MGELIGLCGPIGSGKSTAAACLASVQPDHALYETWHVVAEVASAFNEALKAEMTYETTNNHVDLANQVLIWMPDAISEHLHHDVVWNQLAFSKHDTLTKPELYEKLFVYLTSVGKKRRLLDMPLDDSSKEHFRPLLQWLGNYLVIKISKTIWYDELLRRIALRDPTTSLVVICGVRYPSDAEMVRKAGGHVVVIDRPGHQAVAHDPTEDQRASIKPDSTLVNNGTPDQLQVAAENLWNDLAAGNLQPRYTAA